MEHELIKDIIISLDKKNVEDFESLLYNYNKIIPFDNVLLKLLIKIKE